METQSLFLLYREFLPIKQIILRVGTEHPVDVRLVRTEVERRRTPADWNMLLAAIRQRRRISQSEILCSFHRKLRQQ